MTRNCFLTAIGSLRAGGLLTDFSTTMTEKDIEEKLLPKSSSSSSSQSMPTALESQKNNDGKLFFLIKDQVSLILE